MYVFILPSWVAPRWTNGLSLQNTKQRKQAKKRRFFVKNSFHNADVLKESSMHKLKSRKDEKRDQRPKRHFGGNRKRKQ